MRFFGTFLSKKSKQPEAFLILKLLENSPPLVNTFSFCYTNTINTTRRHNP